MDIHTWAERAPYAPEHALAGLVYALQHDQPALQQCTRWIETSTPAHLALRQACEDALSHAKPLPELKEHHALTLMRALDTHVYAFTGGADDTPDAIGDHTPPLLLIPTRFAVRSTFERQPDFLTLHHPNFRVIPQHLDGFDVRIHRHAAAGAPPDNVRVFAAGFADGVQPLFDPTGPFRTIDVTDPARRTQEALALLGLSKGAHVVVLPELTMPTTACFSLLDALDNQQPQPIVVVAGSYHQVINDENYNVATWFNGQGRPLFTHRKLRRIHVQHHNGDVFEDIDTGSEIHLVDTPLGLATIAICRDFCEDSLEGTWRALQPDLVLLPTMGNAATMHAHHRRAETLGRLASTVVVLANQAPPGEPSWLTGGALLRGKAVSTCIGEVHNETRLTGSFDLPRC